MKALLIPANSKAPVVEIDLPQSDSEGLVVLQAAVGGYIQGLPVPGRTDALAYINEEGIHLGLPGNRRATALLMPPDAGYFPGDFIKGDCVITGKSGPDTTTVPPDIQVPE